LRTRGLRAGFTGSSGGGITPKRVSPGRNQFTAVNELQNNQFNAGNLLNTNQFNARQAQENGQTLEQELQFLACHGLLHLLGWDHPDGASLEAMLRRQDKLLQRT
jgi:probable rRNA maturation factor